MIVFHHNDPDGKLSAFLVGHFTLEKDPKCEIRFVEVDYSYLPKDLLAMVSKDEEVWIVDYSIPIDAMVQLLEITSDVTWIDHHQPIIVVYLNHPKIIDKLKGVWTSARGAACLLTYFYCSKLFKNYNPPAIPRFIALISDYDTWTFEHGEITKLFIAGISIEDIGPTSDIWYAAWQSIRYYEKQGIIVQGTERAFSKRILDACGFAVRFHNYSAYVVNSALIHNSVPFEECVPGYAVYIAYCYNDKGCSVSLYSKTVDVAQLATLYKHLGRCGGGHSLTPGKGSAAGFQCEKLDFASEEDGLRLVPVCKE